MFEVVLKVVFTCCRTSQIYISHICIPIIVIGIQKKNNDQYN